MFAKAFITFIVRTTILFSNATAEKDLTGVHFHMLGDNICGTFDHNVELRSLDCLREMSIVHYLPVKRGVHFHMMLELETPDNYQFASRQVTEKGEKLTCSTFSAKRWIGMLTFAGNASWYNIAAQPFGKVCEGGVFLTVVLKNNAEQYATEIFGDLMSDVKEELQQEKEEKSKDTLKGLEDTLGPKGLEDTLAPKGLEDTIGPKGLEETLSPKRLMRYCLRMLSNRSREKVKWLRPMAVSNTTRSDSPSMEKLMKYMTFRDIDRNAKLKYNFLANTDPNQKTHNCQTFVAKAIQFLAGKKRKNKKRSWFRKFVSKIAHGIANISIVGVFVKASVPLIKSRVKIYTKGFLDIVQVEEKLKEMKAHANLVKERLAQNRKPEKGVGYNFID